MNNKLLLVHTLFFTAIATGCSLAPYQQQPTQQPSTAPPPPKAQTARPAKTPGPRPAATSTIKQRLYSQHREWQGTRYVLGGLSKRGIDCSGLVYTTYRDLLGMELPRTTWDQVKVGRAIKRSQLRAGDLVFFKTGHKTRHVGIYIENDKFLHASTKHGVKISRLGDYYWRDRYWHARRMDLNS